MKFSFVLSLLITCTTILAQNNFGVLTGNILNENHKAIEGATVQLLRLQNAQPFKQTLTDNNGNFTLSGIPFDYYRLQISFVGFQTLTLDSLHFRAERSDFNLSDLVLKNGGGSLGEVIIYAEKPLIQSKEGNITFNAGESALSAGGNASDLLTSVPLITKDADGKILVKGKEPKILIDDKPVELNMQQLQDLLESMPGSSIEKIEVLTNPPPQYANEPGGVINIVLKKGRIGLGGRLSVYAGTRGEKGTNASFNYRKPGLVININAGVSSDAYKGNGRSERENIYPDSSNYFKTNNRYKNENLRPNFRTSIDYDINKQHALNLVLQYNAGDVDNHGFTEYRNINRLNELYKFSTRDLNGHVENQNLSTSLNYTFRSKKAGEVLRVFSDINLSSNKNDRNFLQQFYTPDLIYVDDSLRLQNNNDRNNSYNIRVNYDLPINSKTSFTFGSFLNTTESHQKLDAAYKQKPDGSIVRSELLSNNFLFRQQVSNLRVAFRKSFTPDLRATIGMAVENTAFSFDLYKTDSLAKNHYIDYLPFFSINKSWSEVWNIRLAYRKSIRRPGIGELNPSIDYTDPYNVRFGNPNLEASTAHNFDLTLGKTTNTYYTNIGVGYSTVKDIFSQLRTPISDSKTEITWQNISGRKEYEINSWNGYTINKKLRLNISAGYTYNQYSAFDKEVRKFRNGGSFTSNFNTNYSFSEVLNTTTNFNYNRFANPQGTVRGSVSLNLGIQSKWFQKKFVTTFNVIDPFNQQEYRTYTIGPNFNQENFNSTRTRNFRLSLGYNFTNTPKKARGKEINKTELQNMLKQ